MKIDPQIDPGMIPGVVEQTITFLAEFDYPGPPFKVEVLPYTDLETLSADAYKARHRRKRTDRATGIRYKAILTPYGAERYRDKYGPLTTPDLSLKLGITLDEWLRF